MATSTSTSRVYNFSAGPAVLPLSVLEQIQSEMLSLPGVGSSVLEISHRSKDFDAIIEGAVAGVTQVLNVPDSHEVMFIQGGGALQNIMVPANLITDPAQTADYIQTGSWGKKSAGEVHNYGQLNVAYDSGDTNYDRVPAQADLNLTPDAAYVHLTSNETIQGVQFRELPDTGGVPIVADKSSDLFGEPINVADYGLLYACAQKNAGIAGVTIVVMAKELIERSAPKMPSYLSYAKHSAGGSRFNTPCSFGIYVTGLVCKWLQEEIGGLEKMAAINEAKSKMLYDIIDGSGGFYIGHAQPTDRSTMNVTFKMATPELDAQFVTDAAEAGMSTLKGHRSVGGIRASIYNAMPVQGVEALAAFMKDFAQKNG
jgi:phosphoserine aminotransferase